LGKAPEGDATMKTTTMLLLAGAAAGGYYLYTQSKPKTMSVTGSDGATPTTVAADGNMSSAEIAQTQTQWNTAITNNDQTAATAVVTQLTAAGHPVAAKSLQTILSTAATQTAAAQGYSAGSIANLRRIQALPSLGHLPNYHPLRLQHVHKLAMIGRI
jgi:hypothetical protein